MEQTMVKPWYSECSLDDVRCFIRANLKSVARSVVAVGYYLKSVRDRSLWMDAEQGYESVWDFAQTEFGISKSTASRYMAINDRFSEGGNSPLIMEQYAELSKSQLQEMLYLTDQQAEKVTPDTTVLEIRQMREPKPEPVEVLEGQMSIEDFEIMPAPTLTEETEDPAEEPVNRIVVTAEDLIGMAPQTEDDFSVAISQQVMTYGEVNRILDDYNGKDHSDWDKRESFRTASELPQELAELPPDLAELIFLTVHNFKVEMNRICEEYPYTSQDIWDCANRYLMGGV